MVYSWEIFNPKESGYAGLIQEGVLTWFVCCENWGLQLQQWRIGTVWVMSLCRTIRRPWMCDHFWQPGVGSFHHTLSIAKQLLVWKLLIAKWNPQRDEPALIVTCLANILILDISKEKQTRCIYFLHTIPFCPTKQITYCIQQNGQVPLG